jgi:transcriptional regulator with XRE-family HTH domain
VTGPRRDDGTIRILKALGEAFAEARRGAKLTQAELAERSGVHEVHVARIETGAVDPSYEMMHKLAGSIGVPLGPILDRALELAGKEKGR